MKILTLTETQIEEIISETKTPAPLDPLKYILTQIQNPIIFLELSLKQMQSSIKHEIYHLLSFHMIRARGLKDKYSSQN